MVSLSYYYENKRAIVRGIPNTFDSALSKYMSIESIDVNTAKVQHTHYVAKLKSLNVEILELPSDDTYPDCCFVEDQIVVIHDKGLITNAGAQSRRGERDVIINSLNEKLILEFMEAPAELDGGDVLRVGNILYVGQSTRTNIHGINRLKEFANSSGIQVEAIPIPIDSLHLKSICSSPCPDTLIVAENTLPLDMFHSSHKLILIPKEDVYAANTIGIGQDLIVADEYPKTHKILEEEGFILHKLHMSQIRNADGSLTCLSVFY